MNVRAQCAEGRDRDATGRNTTKQCTTTRKGSNAAAGRKPETARRGMERSYTAATGM